MTATKYRTAGKPLAGVTRLPNPFPGGGSPFFDYTFSPFYTPLPANAAIFPGRIVPGQLNVSSSADLVGAFVNECNREYTQTTVAPTCLTTTRTTMIVAPEDTPLRTDITIDNTSFADDLRAEFAKGIPLPDWAFAGDGGLNASSDTSMALWSPSMDIYWEFFKMAQRLTAINFVSSSKSAGGTLPAGNYFYKVTGYTATGETYGAAGTTITVNGSERAHFSWTGYNASPARHLGYRVYRGGRRIAEVGPGTTTFIDDGSMTPDPNLPIPTQNTATTPGTWQCAWGGVAYNVSESPGYFRNKLHTTAHPEVPGAVQEKFHWGESASQIFLCAGMIQKGDLVRGVIDHVLGIALPNLPGIIHPTAWAWPAQGTDGHSANTHRIPYGIRFRFPYSDAQGTLDFDNYDFGNFGVGGQPALVERLTRFTRIIAKAIQKYGFMPREGSANIIFYPENTQHYTRSVTGYREGTPQAPVDQWIYDDGTSTNFMSDYGPASFAQARECIMALPLDRLVVVNAAFCNNTANPCPRGGKL